jgi:hypothetical protein
LFCSETSTLHSALSSLSLDPLEAAAKTHLLSYSGPPLVSFSLLVSYRSISSFETIGLCEDNDRLSLPPLSLFNQLLSSLEKAVKVCQSPLETSLTTLKSLRVCADYTTRARARAGTRARSSARSRAGTRARVRARAGTRAGT